MYDRLTHEDWARIRSLTVRPEWESFVKYLDQVRRSYNFGPDLLELPKYAFKHGAHSALLQLNTDRLWALADDAIVKAREETEDGFRGQDQKQTGYSQAGY